MSAARAPATAVLGAGVAVGVLGDLLLRAPGAPGLNMSLWIGSTAVATLVLHRVSGNGFDGARRSWIVVGVLFGALLAWRDSPPLKLLALGSATLAFALPAFRATGAWLRRAGVTEYVAALAAGTAHAWFGSALALIEAGRSVPRDETGRITRWRRAAGVMRGMAIAMPLVLVFGALFMAADAVFADLVLETLRFDVELVMSHVLLFGVCTWVATGYIRGSLTGTSVQVLPTIVRRPRMTMTEVATALAMLDLLFLLFVVVQFRYLFGGDALVQVTPDLTYSEYARRGFFELVAAVALVGPILLAADWLLERAGRRDDYVFRSLAGIQVGLVLAIVASALQRMRLYYDAYGLTEARFYATALLLLVGGVLLWFAVTVLRGRRSSFAFGALVAGFATIAALHVASPDALIARTNLARAAGLDGEEALDVAYATSLSADAVPTLLAALPDVPARLQCPIARRMLRRWPPDRELALRSWNWSAARAHAAVREHTEMLRSMARGAEDCQR